MMLHVELSERWRCEPRTWDVHVMIDDVMAAAVG
jgi:hypothetical protein